MSLTLFSSKLTLIGADGNDRNTNSGPGENEHPNGHFEQKTIPKDSSPYHMLSPYGDYLYCWSGSSGKVIDMETWETVGTFSGSNISVVRSANVVIVNVSGTAYIYGPYHNLLTTHAGAITSQFAPDLNLSWLYVIVNPYRRDTTTPTTGAGSYRVNLSTGEVQPFTFTPEGNRGGTSTSPGIHKFGFTSGNTIFALFHDENRLWLQLNYMRSYTWSEDDMVFIRNQEGYVLTYTGLYSQTGDYPNEIWAGPDGTLASMSFCEDTWNGGYPSDRGTSYYALSAWKNGAIEKAAIAETDTASLPRMATCPNSGAMNDDRYYWVGIVKIDSRYYIKQVETENWTTKISDDITSVYTRDLLTSSERIYSPSTGRCWIYTYD